MVTLEINTSAHDEMKDVTRELQAVVSRGGIKNGLLLAYVPHTTAGITINENADPDVVADIMETLSRLIPRQQPHFKHGEGNSAAHVKSTLTGVSITVPIAQGKLVLGTWQSVFFCEFDGPRHRKLHVRVTPTPA